MARHLLPGPGAAGSSLHKGQFPREKDTNDRKLDLWFLLFVLFLPIHSHKIERVIDSHSASLAATLTNFFC